MAQESKTAASQNEIVLAENEMVCSLTNRVVKATEKEMTLQSMIAMMTEEYGFASEDMERDFKVKYMDADTGNTKTQKVDLAIFYAGKAHDTDQLIRFIIVAKDAKVKPNDKSKGVEATIEPILFGTDCEFGCWTNGEDLQYVYKYEDDFGQASCENISDFPACGQTLEDLEAQGERAMPRKPANESLVKTFKRCHDYIYGNEGMKKTAFWELLNLIFCKLYDEKRRFSDAKQGISYRRRFWVGVKEQNTDEGRAAVAGRIKGIFEDLKESNIFQDVFDGNEQIMLSDRGLAFVAGELAKYSFLDATVDVKGTAYETIVSNTLKQEAGQFFTPRNIIKCMVQMLDPDQNTRVLDPACGSGGFLVMVLDHVRRKIARNLYPDLDEVRLEAKYNSADVDDAVREYAEKMIFGFDFDPDLKKAARMNMVMAGDGHANIYNINSLEYPQGSKPDVPLIADAVAESIKHSADKDFHFEHGMNNAQGKFDMVFTNPPFGTKVEVDSDIAVRYELNSKAPEVLFIEACYNFLKPGGKMAIVLPDGILGNPNTESVRMWILRHFKLLASVDLPVETFLPQVGVQASLLFLQKKTDDEMLVPIEDEEYDVFMAIVESVGKDRRGVPVYVKDDDGAELLFENIKKWLSYDEHGNEVVRSRKEHIKHLADDLPMVAEAYKNFLKGEK
ncbi:N-6 DNA methylase [Prevotella nigrescens]|jgi:putative type I restriction-modification system, M subunit|uniref:methylation-associated defense system DNA methyltransferase MAD2 n=1 Tax=Prevotella nigrescens TaxID=28133 RepID=UPI00352DB33F